VLALSLAILTTLAFAALSWRARGSVRTSGAPIVVLGASASCAAALSVGETGASVGASELIVAPMVLALLVALAKSAVTGGRLGVGAVAGLIAILAGAGLIDRIDALNGQLLLVLALAVWWVVNSDEDRARRDDEGSRDRGAALAGLAGVVSGACIGWAVLDGASVLVALGLVSAHLVIWGLRQRDMASAATGAVIATGIAIGCANITRIVGGAMAQPEWGAGQRSQAIALELSGRPYVPGFAAMLPDVMLLIMGVLLALLGVEPGAGRGRRITLASLIGVVALAQALWMWLGAG
jgi:hypothetical protein